MAEETLPQWARWARARGCLTRNEAHGSPGNWLDLYAAADIFLHPTWCEGFPRVILEAMAAGKAVVAFQVGGVGEVIRDEETGLLVAPDDIEGLAGAICRVLQDTSKRMSLGAAARKLVVERYSFETMCLAYARRLDPAHAGELV